MQTWPPKSQIGHKTLKVASGGSKSITEPHDDLYFIIAYYSLPKTCDAFIQKGSKSSWSPKILPTNLFCLGESYHVFLKWDCLFRRISGMPMCPPSWQNIKCGRNIQGYSRRTLHAWTTTSESLISWKYQEGFQKCRVRENINKSDAFW